MRITYLTLLILFLDFGSQATAVLASPNQTQDLNLYQPPPPILLNKSEQHSLQNRHPVIKNFKVEDKTQQLIVFRVATSAEKIWQTIINFNSYPKWVKGVKEARIYAQDSHNYYVAFVISHWLLGTYRYSVWHYLSDDGWMKWQLDQNKPSDFSRSQGFWRVVAVPDEPGIHDVYYSADLHFNKPKAKWLRAKIIKAGLKQASLWVKREAEK